MLDRVNFPLILVAASGVGALFSSAPFIVVATLTVDHDKKKTV